VTEGRKKTPPTIYTAPRLNQQRKWGKRESQRRDEKKGGTAPNIGFFNADGKLYMGGAKNCQWGVGKKPIKKLGHSCKVRGWIG